MLDRIPAQSWFGGAAAAIESPLMTMDLEPYVAEAVGALGYFKPDAIVWFVQSMRKAEKRGTDLDRVMDDRWREYLSEAGNADPLHAVTTTYRRARARARDEAQRQRTLPLLKREPPIFPAVIFHKAPQDPCVPASDIDRSVHRLPPELPLPGCDREICGCSWRTVSKWELDRG
jgi:hypothetical protein